MIDQPMPALFKAWRAAAAALDALPDDGTMSDPAWCAAYDTDHELRLRIVEARPETLADLSLKIRVAFELFRGDDLYEELAEDRAARIASRETLCLSLLRDLVRLQTIGALPPARVA